MSWKYSGKQGWLWIALIIILIVVIFIVTCGTFPIKKESPTAKYDDIDFGKIPADIEKAIRDRERELARIKSEKERIIKKINRIIIGVKCGIVGLWVGGNISIAYFKYGKDYGIGNFLDWNQGLLIVVLFSLFMISERYSNIHTAFTELKEWITAKVMNEAGIHAKRETAIKNELYFLEAVYHCHPGILAKEKEKPLPLGQEVHLN